MSRTNCVNCGASKDIDEIKCPFCGTTYIDMTAIDFDSGKPVVCQFVLPSNFKDKNGNKLIMSMLAIPRLDEIVQTATTVDVCGGGIGYHRMASFVDSWDMNVGVSFKPVTRPDHQTIAELRYEAG